MAIPISTRPAGGSPRAGSPIGQWVVRAQANAPNSSAISSRYAEIPYTSEQGILCGLTGNWIGPSGNFLLNQAIRHRSLVWGDLRCRDNCPASSDRPPETKLRPAPRLLSELNRLLTRL